MPENRFRDFFKEEAQLAGWNEYHQFLIDRRPNANDAVAFVTFHRPSSIDHRHLHNGVGCSQPGQQV